MLVFGALLAFACLAVSAMVLGATAAPKTVCTYQAQFRVTPEARVWRIAFALFSAKGSDFTVRSVKIGGLDVTAAVAARTASLRANAVRVPIDEALADGECSCLAIPVGTLTPLPQSGKDYPVVIELHGPGTGQIIRFETIAAVRSLPADPYWSPAELHIHSSASDGKRTAGELVQPLQDMGYRIVYFTDHIDRVRKRYREWDAYADYVTSATWANPVMRFYPGNEMTVVDSAGKAQGDLLAYGISSYHGLENSRHLPQDGIDDVIANNPRGPSSVAIAHPYRVPSWTDWSVVGYRGFELMSGPPVINYSDALDPPERWRTVLQEQTTTAWFASARAGSDWHQTVFDAGHPGYVTWVNTGQWDSKAAVDAALHAGKTVASRKGSLGYMTLTCGDGTAGIGDRLTGVSAGSPVLLQITFKPVSSATYFIAVCADGNVERVFDSGGVSCEALRTYVFTGSFTAAEGSHYYYLFVRTRGDRHGDEYVYSSPVFVLSG